MYSESVCVCVLPLKPIPLSPLHFSLFLSLSFSFSFPFSYRQLVLYGLKELVFVAYIFKRRSSHLVLDENQFAYIAIPESLFSAAYVHVIFKKFQIKYLNILIHSIMLRNLEPVRSVKKGLLMLTMTDP